MLKVAKLGIAIAAVLAWIVPAAYAGVPSVANSFYVPQRGSVGTPIEGSTTPGQGATVAFHTCPNNDSFVEGTGVFANARIKVVVRDLNGNGIPGVAAADICLLFNGGTAAQGFSGVGADSIIANRQWNPNALCPDVRCVPADAQTDATGTTYITFKGATPGSPGVATRDPIRKWGHFDGEIPVFLLGFKLDGRLTTASANGTYTLRIKNYDISMPTGLSATMNTGEFVNQTDVNQFVAASNNNPPPSPPSIAWQLRAWCDFQGDGVIGQSDVNLMAFHTGQSVVPANPHTCNVPNNP